MTLLEKTYEILKLDDRKLDKHYILKPVRPEEGHPFSFNPYNIPVSKSEKYTREKLAKVLAFIDMKKRARFSDGFTVMNIATTSKRLLSICGTPMSVSRLIKYMIKIGLLAEYDTDYQFNASNSKYNKCKQYVYSYTTEVLVKQYCKSNNINKYVIKNSVRKPTHKIFKEKIKSFEKNEVRFSSKLHLLKPDNYSTTDFEEYLTQCLYKNYPLLKHYQELADYINETFYADDPDRQIQFKPNFTWSKGNKAIRKIGIRATNALVSCKKTREAGDDENIVYRDDVLKRYGLKYEFDVKSSVPRVTYLLNNGEWLDNNIDLYEKMFNNFIHKCPSESMEWNKETREIFKNFHMRGYFDTYSQVAAHLKLVISKKVDYNKDSWSDLDYVMRSYKESIEETVGTLKYDSEVFFHESCIYLDVLFHLLKEGYDVLQIYDGFYTNKECSNIGELVSLLSIQYYNNNNNNNNNTITIYNNNNNNTIHNNNNNIIYNTAVKRLNKKGEDLKKQSTKHINNNIYKLDHSKYDNQLCVFNGETLKLTTLARRFRKAGIQHSTVEAKQYLKR